MHRTVVLRLLFSCSLVWSQFFECHDDPSFDPEDGALDTLQFTWLGVLQYIHVKTGSPHYFRVPRVILITRQFVLSTATDAAQIPEGYALGNVVFGDYERDEKECQITVQDIAKGVNCDPAVLLMPIADVLLHPEYKHFEAKHSIAIMKMATPIRSNYMLPVCLPFKDFLIDDNGRLTKQKLLHIDFVSDVPRDFVEEDKEITSIRILPRELCFLYDKFENSTYMAKNRLACTTGCGFHAGAPTIIHEHTGHWTLISLSQGGSPCPDPLRTRRPPPPPRHILIYPYVTWITAAISGKAVGAFSKDDPFGFVMPRATSTNLIGHGWLGHWWMGGLRCFDRGEAALDLFRFYHEVFQVKPVLSTTLNYHVNINSAHNTLIVCCKVGLPYQLATPIINDIDSPAIRVTVPAFSFGHLYKFQIEAWGVNVSGSESEDTIPTEELELMYNK